MSADVSLMAHLMRRAAFGAPAAELEVLADKGYDAVVDDLLHPERFERPTEDLFERYHFDMAHFRSPVLTSTRWMYRVINSPRPLEEKLALMWHGMFAAASSKVSINVWMVDQIEMFRDCGLGNFRDLLARLSRDPAMIYWLDNQTNHADAPNENYGHELLELFSMGVGNYTEDDVKECARAFTGWTVRQMLPRYPYGFYETEFVYRDDDHDDSVKTFRGEVGTLNGEDVIDVIVRQPATAQFVAHKLYNFFVSETTAPAAIDTLAQAYTDSGYEIAQVMQVLLHSDFFKEARFQKVKSPAELVAGTARLAGLFRNPREYGLMKLASSTGGMDQTLLNPPTVEGWHTGKEWINTASLVERVNFAAAKLGDGANPGIASIIDRALQGRSAMTADQLLNACCYEIGDLELGPKTRSAIVDYLGEEVELRPDSQAGKDRLRNTVAEVLSLIGASREYQMA